MSCAIGAGGGGMIHVQKIANSKNIPAMITV